MKKLRLILLAAVAAMLIHACGEDVPEPQPVPEPDPKADVTLSLGETTKYTVASIIGEDFAGTLSCADDGTYRLVATGDAIELTADPLAGFNGSKMFSRYLDMPLSTDLSFADKPDYTGDKDEVDLSALLPQLLNVGRFSKGVSFTFSGFPSTLATLERIDLRKDAAFDIEVSVVDPCFTGGKLTPTFAVNLSSLFGIKEAESGILAFDVELTPENGYKAVRTFHPETFTVNPENYNAKRHSLLSEIKASATIVASHDGLKTTREKLAAAQSPFKLRVTLTLRNLTIAGLTGTYEYDIQGGSSVVSLGALTAKIGDTGKSLETLGLDPSGIGIAMDVESSLPSPVTGELGIAAKKSRATFGTIEGIAVDIPAVTADGPAKDTYDLGKMEDLSIILSKVADEMTFTAAATAGQKAATFTVDKPAKVLLAPSVTVPLRFGDELEHTAEQRISLPQNAGALLKDGSLTIQGKVSNTFPMDGCVTVTILDAASSALTDAASLQLPAEKETDVNMTFRPKPGSSMENAAAALVRYGIKGKAGSRALKSTDCIQAKLDAKISYAK